MAAAPDSPPNTTRIARGMPAKAPRAFSHNEGDPDMTATATAQTTRALRPCFHHFASTDNRYNGRRVCLYVGKGPKYVSLIVMDSSELTITRVPAIAPVLFMTEAETNLDKAIDRFIDKAREVGCTKAVADLLGIEWPPVSPARAQSSLERRALLSVVENIAMGKSAEEQERRAKDKAKADAKAAAVVAAAPPIVVPPKPARGSIVTTIQTELRGQVARLRSSFEDLTKAQVQVVVAGACAALPTGTNAGTVRAQFYHLRKLERAGK
jgi:hypothetical protein